MKSVATQELIATFGTNNLDEAMAFPKLIVNFVLDLKKLIQIGPVGFSKSFNVTFLHLL